MYRIDELEDAVVSVLSTAGYNTSAFNKEPNDEAFAGLAGESPRVLVVFEGARPAELITTMRKGKEFRFILIVIARNLRGSSSAARGDVSSAGIYSALDGLRAALDGNTLALTVQPAVWISESAEKRDSRLNVYKQNWSITVFE